MSGHQPFRPDPQWFETYWYADADAVRRPARLARRFGAVVLSVALAGGSITAMQRLGIGAADPAVSAASVD